VQDLCTSVFGIPLSKGAIQKMVDPASEAILPHYTAIGGVARASLVNYMAPAELLGTSDPHGARTGGAYGGAVTQLQP
jgi:hypothetical protein